MTKRLYPDNGGSSGAGYWPSLEHLAFALQLRGPFSAGVRAGFHRLPLSVPSFRRLLVLFAVFGYKIHLIIWMEAFLSRLS